jgi:hypothetical protein
MSNTERQLPEAPSPQQVLMQIPQGMWVAQCVATAASACMYKCRQSAACSGGSGHAFYRCSYPLEQELLDGAIISADPPAAPAYHGITGKMRHVVVPLLELS